MAEEEDFTTINVTAILNGDDITSAPSFAPTLQFPQETEDFIYRCSAGAAPEDCASTCLSLEECLSCDCMPVYLDAGGPWGDVMDLLLCLLPILYLIFATVKPNPTPTTRSLPTAALFMLLVRLMYLGSNPLLVMGCTILGVHEALTPLSIMAGAITLFETMEATKCLPFMMREMKALTDGHPVAECMLLFAFAYLVEGASGFGTPVALGAPMLVSTGNPAMESVVIMLCFNTFATVWGAVGTPLWFGFGDLGLTEDELAEISIKAAVCMVVAAFILLPFILTILVPFKVIRANLIFLVLSIASVMGPVVALANFNYEFPSLMGGLIGCGLTAMLIKFKIGLASMEPYLDDIKRSNTNINMNNMNNNNNHSSNINNHDEIRKIVNDLSQVSERASHQFLMHNNNNNNNNPEHEQDKHDGNGTTTPTTTTQNANDNSSMNGGDTNTLTSGKWEQQDVTVDPNADGTTETTVVHIEKENTTTTSDEEEHHPSQSHMPSLLQVQEAMGDGGGNVVDDSGLGPRKSYAEGYLMEMILRTFPIWGVVVLLILTRVQVFSIKEYLTKQTPHFSIYFGSYGEFRLSASVVFQLRDILTYPGMNWKYELFYVPFLVPFILISGLTMILFRKDMTLYPQDIAATVVQRLTNPAIALMGALILVQLMIRFGTEAPAYILGNILADWLKEGFIAISPLLGALGSFFSGSTTVSNLTFGEIQRIAAESIGTSVTSMLALQVVGASAGNGICLNNIIAALAVVGLNVSEGQILVKTCRYVFSLTTIATVVMLAIFFRFD